MGDIKERLRLAGDNWQSEPMKSQLAYAGEAIESELKKLGERIDENPLPKDLNPIGKALQEHEERIGALEQKPPPEPARLKFGDLVYHTHEEKYGVFIRDLKDGCSCYGVLDQNGHVRSWHYEWTVFKARPEKPKGDS